MRARRIRLEASRIDLLPPPSVGGDSVVWMPQGELPPRLLHFGIERQPAKHSMLVGGGVSGRLPGYSATCCWNVWISCIHPGCNLRRGNANPYMGVQEHPDTLVGGAERDKALVQYKRLEAAVLAFSSADRIGFPDCPEVRLAYGNKNMTIITGDMVAQVQSSRAEGPGGPLPEQPYLCHWCIQSFNCCAELLSITTSSLTSSFVFWVHLPLPEHHHFLNS